MAVEQPTKPVLFSGEEIADCFDGSPRYMLPRSVMEPIVAQKQADPSVPDGAIKAARWLLSQAANSIHFFDTAPEPAATDFGDDEEDDIEPTFGNRQLLGFNDHGGGSESGHKILVNQFAAGRAAKQYVLYAPPGTSSNLTFHHADFTFLTWRAKGRPATNTPNPLKTSGVAGGEGRNYYEHILFGDSSTPDHFLGVLQFLGFEFIDRPYSQEEYDKIKSEKSLYKIPHEQLRLPWPGRQFAQQLAKCDDPAATHAMYEEHTAL